MFLDMAGYQVKLATNGQQAIEIVEEESPGIILMDMHMPVMDGETATREIRSKGYNGPILALTASTDEDIIANMRAAGSDGEIIKPVQADSLIRSVARYLLPVASE